VKNAIPPTAAYNESGSMSSTCSVVSKGCQVR
jgi:hypothetical protein